MRRLDVVLAGLGACLAITLSACGSAPDTVGETVATVSTVRGDVQVGDTPAGPLARVIPGASVVCAEAARARVALDSGPRLLLDQSSTLTVAAADAVEVVAGRVYVDVYPF